VDTGTPILTLQVEKLQSPVTKVIDAAYLFGPTSVLVLLYRLCMKGVADVLTNKAAGRVFTAAYKLSYVDDQAMRWLSTNGQQQTLVLRRF